MKKTLLALALAFASAIPMLAAAQNTNVPQTVVQVDVVNRRMSVGIDPSVASPTATFDVSGTQRLAATPVTPTVIGIGQIAVNISGTVCYVSGTAFYEVGSKTALCSFVPAK